MSEIETSLVDDFQEYFTIELATAPVQMEKIYGIRYRVYCEEFGYEPADHFPNKQETDSFDVHSVHALVTHKSSGRAAGCVRAVEVSADTQMPMEVYCSDSLDAALMKSLAADRGTICEISRLAVDAAFRRRPGENISRFGEITSLDCTKREQRTFSLIAVATLLAGFAIADLLGRPNTFAMMEPFLPRLLGRSGMKGIRVGEDTNYHGVRAGYFNTTEVVVAGMPAEWRELYKAIRMGFGQALRWQRVPKRKILAPSGPSNVFSFPGFKTPVLVR
jgi:N-acyl amino acid synthase of PEP-CTERM/exosortase system